MNSMDNKDMDILAFVEDFEIVKEKIIFSVVNADRNADMLAVVPHKNWEDLAIIYKIFLGGVNGYTAAVIKNGLFDLWNVSLDVLHEYAMKNTCRLLPVTIEPLYGLLVRFLDSEGEPEEVVTAFLEEASAHQQYIISNAAHSYGAASMLYTDKLSALADKIGKDFYILPSSVHECITMPTDEGSPEMFREWVRSVNESEVEPNERLSNNIYKFDAAAKTLSLVV